MQEEITVQEQESETVAKLDGDSAADAETAADTSNKPEKKSRGRKPKKAEEPAPKEEIEKSEPEKTFQAGDTFETKAMRLYRSSAAPKPYKGIRGKFYIWNSAVIDGRIRITDSQAGVGNLKNLIGWVNLANINR